MWYTYIVLCKKNNSYYTGSTSDVIRRVQQHNEGSGAKYTRAFGPVELLYYESQEDRSHACKREYEIKCLTRSEKEELVNSPRNELSR